MKLKFALYIACLTLYIASSQLFAFNSEMRVYDVKTHILLGTYQRMGTINGYESGIVKMPHQISINVIEKPAQTCPLEQTSPDLVGYIKCKTIIRESGNSSKRSYLYQAELPQDRVEIENVKKKHNHLMP